MIKNKFIITLIILLSIIFITYYINKKDYDKISCTFYKEILTDYLNKTDDEVGITFENFINLKSKDVLAEKLIQDVLTSVPSYKIKLINNVNEEYKSIHIEFITYDLDSLKFNINVYYGDVLKEIRNYEAKYVKGKWIVNSNNMSNLD